VFVVTQICRNRRAEANDSHKEKKACLPFLIPPLIPTDNDAQETREWL